MLTKNGRIILEDAKFHAEVLRKFLEKGEPEEILDRVINDIETVLKQMTVIDDIEQWARAIGRPFRQRIKE